MSNRLSSEQNALGPHPAAAPGTDRASERAYTIAHRGIAGCTQRMVVAADGSATLHLSRRRELVVTVAVLDETALGVLEERLGWTGTQEREETSVRITGRGCMTCEGGGRSRVRWQLREWRAVAASSFPDRSEIELVVYCVQRPCAVTIASAGTALPAEVFGDFLGSLRTSPAAVIVPHRSPEGISS